MKLGKYASVILAIATSLTLIVVAAVSLRLISAYDKANVSHHLLTRLQTTYGLVELWQDNYLNGVKALAEDPSLAALVDKLLTNQIDSSQAAAELDKWLRPIYLGRGYEGHAIISRDTTILLTSSPAFIGKQVVSRDVKASIGRAFSDGSVLTKPVPTAYELRLIDRIAPAGTLLQMGCAQIKKNENTLAILCLHRDPYHTLFPLLRTGFSGKSGEAYAVDRHGNIISPTRFGQMFVRNSSVATTPIYVQGLQARVPTKTKHGVLVNANSPLTKSVKMALEHGESGLIDSYRDYRGISVVGAVKWLPLMDIGIVVEQDAEEVYAPFNFFRNSIIGFTLLAITLINLLLVVMIRSRKSLAEREQSMRAFLNHLPGFTHMRSPEGKFLMVNQNMEKYLGLTKMVGTDANALPFEAASIREINMEHEKIVHTGEVIEKTIYVKDLYPVDKIDWVKLVRFPIFDPETHSVNAVGTIMLDISEQMINAQKLEAISQNLENIVAQRTAQLETAKQEAEQAARAKSDFLANMSHEIRTPMNAIIGLSHLATLVSDDPKLRSYLERIHQSSNHLLSIVNDILDFSKIEAGHMTIEQADFSLEEVLDNALGLLWERAHTKGLELLLDMDLSLPQKLKGDALRIGQILINFTSNAVKFTEQGEVLVSVTKVSETNKSLRVRFSVKDTGIGIAAEQFDQLFKPFQQLDNSSTRRFEGTGLGLTISRDLVELMGGKLDFTSTPGVGSNFSFELDFGKTASPEQPRPIASTQGKRILVVDKHSQSRRIISKMLEALAMEVCTVQNLEDAESSINHDNTFDIILIDWQIPGASGLDAARQLQKLPNTRNSRFVLLCGHSKHHVGNAAEELFTAIITKPLLMSALQDALVDAFKNNYSPDPQSLPFDIAHYQQLAGCRVLLVDDNAINQDVVVELLNLVKAQITTATNGQEAIKLLEQETFDLVLMDVQMPVMDGIEATRYLRARPEFEQLPIIALTASALSGDRERCLSAGMNDYISKPIYPDVLFRILLRWLSPPANAIEPKESRPLVQKSKTTELVAPLYHVAGLEVDDALERLLHNEILYVTLIKRFIQERETVADQMEASLAANKLDELSHTAHSFKSLAGTIGATQLQSLALAIEMNLSDQQDVTQLLRELRVALEILIGDLRLSLKL